MLSDANFDSTCFLYQMYQSPVVGTVKKSRMRWTEHIAGIGKQEVGAKFSLRKSMLNNYARLLNDY